GAGDRPSREAPWHRRIARIIAGYETAGYIGLWSRGRMARRVIAIDIDPGMLALARAKVTAADDAALRRKTGVALGHAVLHLDGAVHSVDHAAELDEDAVAGALHNAPVMRGDGGINQIAPQPPESRQGAIRRSRQACCIRQRPLLKSRRAS